MLDQLKRFFNAVEKEPEMVQETSQAPVLADNTAELASVQAALASQAEAFATVTEQMTELTAKYEEAVAKLSAIEADKAQLVADAQAKVIASRSEKLTAILGTVKAPAVLAALENLDDATFETVLGTYAANFEAEKNSAMFTESGVSAEAEQPAEELTTVARLEAKINAQFKTK